MHNGHAVDVVEAENRPFSRSKGSTSGAAEQREMELLETEAFNELNTSDDDQSSGNVTYRVSDERTGSVPVIRNKEPQGVPRWDARWPIDVWVSCGEPFVPLEGRFKTFVSSCFILCKLQERPPTFGQKHSMTTTKVVCDWMILVIKLSLEALPLA